MRQKLLSYRFHQRGLSQLVSVFFRVKLILLSLFDPRWRPATRFFKIIFNEDYLSLMNYFCSIQKYIHSQFATMNIMTMLNFICKYYLVLSPIFRNMTFDILWFIVCITQSLTVHRDLIFAIFLLNLDRKE